MHQMNLNRVDLNLLVVFEAVARTRSVTTAATELSLSQPAVSHALKRLRALMRDPLFIRGSHGLILTTRAEKCVAEVSAILAAVDNVLTTGRFDPTTTTCTFRFGASDYSMVTVIPAVVRKLRTLAPHADIGVAHIDANVPAQLEKGEFDIAFVGASQTGETVRTCELFRERFIGLMCRRHPLAARALKGKLTLTEYLAYPHIAVTFRNSILSPIDVKLAKLGKTRHVQMVTPNFAANVASLHGTDLLMSLPSRLAIAADDKKLVNFKLPLAVPDYPYMMSWHKRTDDDTAMKWLRDLVVAAATTSVVPKAPFGPFKSLRAPSI